MKRMTACILTLSMLILFCSGAFAENALPVATETDQRGRVIKETFVDANGNPCAGPDGYTIVQYAYNKLEKLPFRISYADAEGNPCMTGDGYYAKLLEYGPHGRVTSETYLGADGKPCRNTEGFSRVSSSYISTGDVKVRRYWDENGKAIIVPGLGYAMLDNDYTNGLIVSTVFRDTEKEPIDCVKGYACIKYRYEKKKPVRVQWLHADLKTPATNEDGYSAKEQKWDKEGNLLEEIFYDEQGQVISPETVEKKQQEAAELQPVTGKEYAYIRMAYSEDGKTCEISYYDAKKQPMRINAGYAKRICEMDDEGNIIRERYRDEADMAVYCASGYAEVRRTYHTPELLSGVAWFDTNGQPMPLKDLYVRLEREYDEADNIIAERYYDEKDQRTACAGGYAEARYAYDEARRQIRASFHDANGNAVLYKGFAVRTREYDSAGNVTVERYFDGAMNPVINVNGYAEMRRSYAEDGKVTLTQFFDTKGNLIAEQ